MNKEVQLRADMLLFLFNLKTTFSDCKSGTAKAVASAKTKAGNLRITALGIFL